MSTEHKKLTKHLKKIIKNMKKVQKSIRGSKQPASMHEIDELIQLGEEYASTVQQIAQLESQQKTKHS